MRATGWRAVPARPRTVDAPAGRLLPGLLRQVYRGINFDKLVYAGPDPQVKIQRIGTVIHSRKVEGLPVAPEISSDGPEAGLPAVGPFSVRWAGWLQVRDAGTYGVAVNSDDGAILRIGGVPVVSDWGPHGINRRETRVELAAGWYAVEVEYMQDAGDSVLDLEWRPPGGAWQHLDGKVLRHAAAVAGQAELEPIGPAPAAGEDEEVHGVDVVYRPMTEMPTSLEVPVAPAVPSPGPFDVFRTVDRVSLTRGLMPLDSLALPPETDPRWGMFSASWEGLLVVKEAGKYRFRITVDDGAKLTVADRVVVDAWRYQDRVTQEGELDLTPGFVPFRLSYFNGLGNASLRPEWQVPGKPWAPIDSSVVRRARRASVPPSLDEPLWIAGWTDLALKRDTDLVAPFVHRWNALTDGFPRHRPRPLVRLEATLAVPQAGFHTFWLRAAGAARARIGAERLEVSGHRGPVAIVTYLNEGQQPVTLDYLGPGGGEQLSLEWSGPSFERRAIGPRDLVRLGGGPTLWSAGALALLGALLLALNGAGARDAALTIGPRAALGLIFVLALCARLDGYQRLPSTGDTDDEITPHLSGYWSARGLAPASWDCVRVFRERYVVEVNGRIFPVVLPFLEYPPLFDAAVGQLMRIFAPHGPFDLPLHLTRLFPIALSAWCAVLLYLLALELELGTGVALAAAAIHALCPLAVLSARLVKADSLLAVLGLLATLNAVRYRRRGGAGALFLALAAVPLAVLTKPTGLALAPAVAFPLLAARRPFAGFAALGTALAGVALWLGWGYAWDGARFFELVGELTQHHHKTNLSAFLPLVSTSRVTAVEWGAEWWLGLLLLGLGGLLSSRRAAPVASLALFYLVAVAATYDAGHNFGWYRMPLYPPLALGLAVYLGDLARRADPARAFLAAGLLLLPALHVLVPEPYATSRTLLQLVLLAAAALPSLALLVERMRAPLQVTTPLVIAAVLLISYAVADVRLSELYPTIGSPPDVCPNTPLAN